MIHSIGMAGGGRPHARPAIGATYRGGPFGATLVPTPRQRASGGVLERSTMALLTKGPNLDGNYWKEVDSPGYSRQEVVLTGFDTSYLANSEGVSFELEIGGEKMWGVGLLNDAGELLYYGCLSPPGRGEEQGQGPYEVRAAHGAQRGDPSVARRGGCGGLDAELADVAAMVEAREQFDWVIIEEAAKATGPELFGEMMLSGRRLLIGDHRQLPAFDADRMVTILENHSLVDHALREASPLLSSLLRNDELDDVTALLGAGPSAVQAAAHDARRLLEPFRTFVEEDDQRAAGSDQPRRISATLSEQRRMDPAIARIVSRAFYGGDLKTSRVRRRPP